LLPIGLPNSFSQSGAKFSASIFYKLEAFLQPAIEKKPKLKHKQSLVVREASAAELFQPAQKEQNQQIFGGCLGWYKKGSVQVRAQNAKTAYTPGELLTVELDFDNSQSQMKCERIIFQLKQRIILRAKHSVFYHEIALNQKEFPSINAGALGQKLTFEFKLPLENNQSVNKAIPSKEDLLQQNDNLNTVGSVCPSTDLTSIFLLEVLCLMEGYIYHPMNAVKLEFPIQILHPEPEGEKIAAPKNWNPQLMKTFTTTFSYSSPEGEGEKNYMINSGPVHPI